MRGRTVSRLAAVVPATVLTLAAFGAPAAVAATGNGAARGAASDHSMAGTMKNDTASTSGHATRSDTGSTTASDHQTNGTAGTSGDPTQRQPQSTADQNSGGANGKCPDGPYCSTRDGSPSGNGNGNGQATGKPCAGCVGKADNKNPQGQYPNGSDHNAGYECDRNHGIGRTNPAHTGCTSTTQTCPEGEVLDTETGQCTTPPSTCPEGEVLDTETGECTTPPSTCPEGEVLDTETGQCTTPPSTCPEGEVLDTETGECTTPPSTCPAGSVVTGGECTTPQQCVPTTDNDFCSNVEGEQHHRPTTSVEGKQVLRTPTVTPAVSPTGAGVLPFTGVADLTWLVSSGTLLLGLGAILLVTARRRRRQPTA
jgi:hypothetical protein